MLKTPIVKRRIPAKEKNILLEKQDFKE